MIEEVKVFSDLSSTGALMWVVYYCLNAIPKIIDKNDHSNAEARTQYLAEIKDSREWAKNELAAERAHCAEELRIARENEKDNREVFNKGLSELRQLITGKQCPEK